MCMAVGEPMVLWVCYVYAENTNDPTNKSEQSRKNKNTKAAKALCSAHLGGRESGHSLWPLHRVRERGRV